MTEPLNEDFRQAPAVDVQPQPQPQVPAPQVQPQVQPPKNEALERINSLEAPQTQQQGQSLAGGLINLIGTVAAIEKDEYLDFQRKMARAGSAQKGIAVKNEQLRQKLLFDQFHANLKFDEFQNRKNNAAQYLTLAENADVRAAALHDEDVKFARYNALFKEKEFNSIDWDLTAQVLSEKLKTQLGESANQQAVNKWFRAMVPRMYGDSGADNPAAMEALLNYTLGIGINRSSGNNKPISQLDQIYDQLPPQIRGMLAFDNVKDEDARLAGAKYATEIYRTEVGDIYFQTMTANHALYGYIDRNKLNPSAPKEIGLPEMHTNKQMRQIIKWAAEYINDLDESNFFSIDNYGPVNFVDARNQLIAEFQEYISTHGNEDIYTGFGGEETLRDLINKEAISRSIRSRSLPAKVSRFGDKPSGSIKDILSRTRGNFNNRIIADTTFRP